MMSQTHTLLKVIKYLINYIALIISVFFIYTIIIEGELLELGKFLIITLFGLFFLAFAYYYQGYKLRFLIMCILLATFGYFYTYQMQYDFPQYGYSISSSINIEKSENFTFLSFEQRLLYLNKYKTANLVQELYIFNNKPVETYISFNPPANTTYYDVNIIANVNEVVLLSINGTYNQSNKFVYKLKFPSGTHVIKMRYDIKDVEPFGLVRFWIFGGKNQPKIGDLWASVIFSKLKYHCSNPCIIVPDNRGYYTIVERAIPYQNISRKIIAYNFNIYLKNSSEMGYVIWTSYKNPIILRNLLFALLVGLFVQVFGILIEKREEYIQMVKSSYHLVITKLRR